ncbi:MAG TPA: hypothetical protein VK788_02085 [Terriglobales bacterium]|jgi:hypothetical protein|nr:hypothetical protein [Terriglobales bacterium]
MTETTMERIPPVAVKDMRAMWNFLRGVESRVGRERGSVFVGEGAWRAAFGDRDLSAVNRRCVRLDITTRAYGIDIDKWPSLFRNLAFMVAAYAPFRALPIPKMVA